MYGTLRLHCVSFPRGLKRCALTHRSPGSPRTVTCARRDRRHRVAGRPARSLRLGENPGALMASVRFSEAPREGANGPGRPGIAPRGPVVNHLGDVDGLALTSASASGKTREPQPRTRPPLSGRGWPVLRPGEGRRDSQIRRASSHTSPGRGTRAAVSRAAPHPACRPTSPKRRCVRSPTGRLAHPGQSPAHAGIADIALRGDPRDRSVWGRIPAR